MGMNSARRIIIGAFAAAVATSGVVNAEEAHHPEAGVQAPQVQTQPAPPSPTPQGGMMPMMGMMGQGGMGMMGQGGMGMMGGGSPADMRLMLGHDAMIDRIEGRIAFLRAELKITDAQEKSWAAFADALRANAKRLGELRAAAKGSPASATLVDRLDRQERWLVARVEGVRAIKTQLASLYAVLADDQRKDAEELLARHIGFAPMGMTSAARGMR